VYPSTAPTRRTLELAAEAGTSLSIGENVGAILSDHLADDRRTLTDRTTRVEFDAAKDDPDLIGLDRHLTADRTEIRWIISWLDDRVM
jgi:hypothetical protein